MPKARKAKPNLYLTLAPGGMRESAPQKERASAA